MKAILRRNLLFVAITLIMMVTLAACGGGNEKASSVTPKVNGGNTVTEEVKEVETSPAASYYSEEPATIRMYTSSAQSWPFDKEWPIWKWIKEETNITIDGEIQTGNYEDTLALNIASGDLQDIIYVPSQLTSRYGSEGVFLDLSQHLDKMPNVQKYLENNPQIKSRVTAPGGEIYHIALDGAGITNQMIMFYRDDIFQKHNLTPPTTWEELYTVSKALKELYPDSFPFIYRHGLNNLSNFAPAFGTGRSYYPNPETGEVKYGPIEDSFKDMVSYLNKFYLEGLNPPDFLSMDAKTWTQAMVTDNSFITIQYIGQMEIINNQLTSGELKLLPPPAGTGGKQYAADTNMEYHGYAVYSKSKNIDAALKVLDYAYSDEGSDVLSWGKENETYTMVDGERKFNAEFVEFTDLRKNVGIMTPGAYGLFDTDALISMISEKERYAYQEAPKYAFPVQVVTPNFTPEELERFSIVNESINKHFQENMAKFIMGVRPLDQWDQYKDEVKKLGVEEMITLHQTAWDRQK